MKTRLVRVLIVGCLIGLSGVIAGESEKKVLSDEGGELVISRQAYAEGLQGFWLAQCIANWTGLITEMDKIEAPFYTDENWGGPDEPNIWGGSGLSPTIDFFLVGKDETWGADDDTDLEYLYQYRHELTGASKLSPEQIRDGWLEHLWSDNYNKDGENFLWVSNENALELMRKGHLPPETSDPKLNPDFEMIDAQLTTEIFGLFAPGRPEVALDLAKLPIGTSARENARWAAEFYVIMHALAVGVDRKGAVRDQVFEMAAEARAQVPDDSVIASMYDYVKAEYEANPDKSDWERTRDGLYEEYQLGGRGGYVYAKSFDAAINFGASMVSLFYGEGDLKRTIQIGVLAGWDSDNPTATWAGLLGFILGRSGVEEAFGTDDLSETYRISRTRRNFPDRTPGREGEDTFPMMAERGLGVIDRIVTEQLNGRVDRTLGRWIIPSTAGE